jgi:redox-sensitive bicupin YhaK (pirin superfamily)
VQRIKNQTLLQWNPYQYFIYRQIDTKVEIIRSEERGFFDHGWLKTYHTFSFAEYYNPQRMHFGAIRVLNDDVVDPHMGFGTHAHQNMEIISVPLQGALKHKDSMGTSGVITSGEVQVMSAGTGINHSEMNAGDVPVNFLQIWIFPDKKNVKPRYDQKEFKSKNKENIQQLLVSPDGREDSLWIYQKAYISKLQLTGTKEYKYSRYRKENGILSFLIQGQIVISEIEINERDTILTPGNEKIIITQYSDVSEILFIEVPMLT